jgi:patatin-related protein
VRERELRLAVVFFGGVSLAVYMHGISKEILKLARASAALHAIRDRAARAEAQAAGSFEPGDPEYDTEAVYFDLLREIGRQIDLRVVVDIVAGASAGGINGVMLSRALAHNLSHDGLRRLWLDQADAIGLLAADRRAKAWNKWILKPFVWAAGRSGLFRQISDPEVRAKLSLFMRSRWFRPPFDGPHMSELMLDAVRGMTPLRNGGKSLLPTGQYLETFVTLTDFHGYRQAIRIHDPPLIHEQEHRHILRFRCRHWPGGEIESDFALENAASLAFAARATSAFPGAFPPATIGEMDGVLARRQAEWPTRAAFLRDGFTRYHQAGSDPAATAFIDGAVLNNKPFREAIRSIAGRPAFREVDRRLIYVDPSPSRPAPTAANGSPGFFPTLKAALSDIPRNQPITDELDWVMGFNERVQRQRAVIDAARPQVAQLVADIAPGAETRAFTAPAVRFWREAANMRVAETAGFAYEGYVRLKLFSAIAFVGRTIAALCLWPERSAGARSVAAAIEAWVRLDGIVYQPSELHFFHREAGLGADQVPLWVTFLLRFDLEFRKRRLGFLVQGQNRLYETLDAASLDGAAVERINWLKREFYRCLDALRRRENPDAFPEARTLARALFSEPGSAEPNGDVARRFAERHRAEIGRLVETLAAEIDLDAATGDVDELLAGMDPALWSPAIRREVLVNYLGFPFWDLLTFSVTSWSDSDEFHEIRVDRISLDDCRTLTGGDGLRGLKGTDLANFGAFFSRSYRENDYLQGRLTAAERLIDIVCDAAGRDLPGIAIDPVELKRRAFEIILEAERPHLGRMGALIDRCRAILRGG